MSNANSVLTEQEYDLISECARRLRLIQADTATAPPEQRREFLQEEVARTLKGASSSDRRRLLDALLHRFPVAGQIAGGSTVQPPPAPVAEPKRESPEELFQRFLSIAHELPAETRVEWGQRLAEAGIAIREQRKFSVEVPREWLSCFGLKDDQQPDLDRLVALAATLTELVHRVDQAARKALVELRPRGAVQDNREDLLMAFAQYLTGKTESVEPELRALSSLLGALLAGILTAGRSYGKDFLRLCSPMAIEETIKLEGGAGLFGRSFEGRCWDKYKDLAKGFSTPELIDRQIRDCMAAAVKSKMSANR